MGGLAILCPFQQCIGHIRTVCNGAQFMVDKISPQAEIELSLVDQ